MRYAIVSNSGVVTDVVMWDGDSAFELPYGYQLIKSYSAGIGYTYANGDFSCPVVDITPISSDEQWITYKARAQSLLDKTSVTIERIIEGLSLIHI